jgi:hypothetical protein
MKFKPMFTFALLFYTTLSFQLYADKNFPTCLDQKSQVLPIDSNRVIRLKSTTANQFLTRAHIQGEIVKIYPDRNGHDHFSISIGPLAEDTLEVVYNSDFGSLGELKEGMTVEACGDYITSNAPTSQYQASPDGAIIHWVHRSNNPRKHATGYLVVNGSLYGGFIPPAQPTN